jgi:glycosyltransferase involved in cell wall biosynthesis
MYNVDDIMRILQLAPRFPFPPDDGGKISIANITREFSKAGHDITLFAFEAEMPDASILALAEKYANIHIQLHSTKNTIPRIIWSILKGESLYTAKHSYKHVFQEFHDKFKEQKFDIIHADHTSMAPLALFAKSFMNAPVGLRLHNIEYQIWKRYAEALKAYDPKLYYIKHQTHFLKNTEKELIKNADVNFAITRTDKQRALELSPEANVLVATAGVNPTEWQPDDSIERNSHELILATTYHWVHNRDAVRWFCSKVLPLVRKEIPDVTLSLIGKNPPDFLNDYKDQGVKVLGYVDSVQPYLNKASIYIAPLFVGSGIRIKILEAMAMKLPVVASPIAAEGIFGNDSNGLLIRESAIDFAKAIVDLCRNTDKVLVLGENARKFILEEFSWKKNINIMLDEYQKLLK